jgi:translocation and assembly module TamA
MQPSLRLIRRKQSLRGHLQNLAIVLLCLWLLAGCSLLPKKDDHGLVPTDSPPSFALVVECSNSAVRDLLTEHLDLQRYRHLPDLSDSEIDNLMSQATQDASDLLATQGYINPEIALDYLPADEKNKLPRIVIKVEVGKPTIVASSKLKFEGHIATAVALPETIQRRVIRQFWQLRKDQRFTQTRWDDAKSRALRDLNADRYLAGRVAQSDAQLDADKNEAQLQLTLDSGPVYHFGAPQIQGNVNFEDETVERFLRLPKGDSYSLTRLLQAQQRLVDTGFFDSVFLYMDPKADPEATPVQVQVSEAKLQKLVLGVGASTNNGGRLSVEHIHNISPFFGWRSHLKGNFDKRETGMNADVLSLPSADYWRWSLGAGYSREQDEGQTTHSGTLRMGRLQTGDTIDRALYLEYNRSRWTVFDASGSSPSYPTYSAFSANWAWTARHFDSMTFPTEGYGFGLELGTGLAVGNGQKIQAFSRVLGRWQSYHPLDDIFPPKDSKWRIQSLGRIALRAQVGAVMAKKDAPVPAKLLFLTGGDGSVRGYPYRGITARDIAYMGKNYPQPGRYLLVGSAEWQRPIYIDGARSDWESAVFMDTGAVADEAQKLALQTGVGVGARWRSPIGPFQADLAYGVKLRKLRLHLSVGFVF